MFEPEPLIASASSGRVPPTQEDPRSRLTPEAARHFAAGDAWYAQGRLADAQRHYEEALRLQPDSAWLNFRLGTCHWASGRRDEAYHHLEAAVRLDDRLALAHEWLSQWLLQEGMVDAALRHSTRAIELEGGNKSVMASHAFVLEAAGELDAAWALVRRLLDAGYTPPRVAMLYGRMSRWRGESARALELIQRLLGDGTSQPHQRAGLHHAAAELLDVLGRYDEAFAHASQGNRLKPAAYDPLAARATIDGMISYFTRPHLRRLPRATYRSDKPVFIVGMPRSGTSLVEQILGSHPQVHGAGELDFINRIGQGMLAMLGAQPHQYPWCIDRLTIDQADGLAQVYIDPLVALRPDALRITDKMPLNFVHLGLIAILLPEARVIHCRRDAMDTCLSCYMTHFTTGNEFASDLTHLGLFYREYQTLMSHWKEVLDLPILDVDYEQVVAQPEAQARRMIEFLDLEWDEHCVRFYESRRSVATASVEQVRQPAYTSSVGRWTHYEKHLAPLKQILSTGMYNS